MLVGGSLRERKHKVEWVGKRIWEELGLGRNNQICEKYIKNDT